MKVDPAPRTLLLLLLPAWLLVGCAAEDPGARLEEARSARAAGLTGDAAAILSELLRRSPGDFTLQYELALTLHRGGESEAALEAISGAIEANPRSLDARVLHGEILSAIGREGEGLGVLRRVVASDRSRPGVHRIMGTIHARAGRPGRAINQFEKELAINGNDPDALTAVGILYLNTDENDKAADRLRRAVTVDPDSAEAHWYYAEVLFRQERRAEGLEEQRRAFELDPDDINRLVDHARALSNYGYPEEAWGILQDALDRGLEEAQIHVEIAHQAKKRLDYDVAAAALKRALEIDPESFSAYSLLGKLLRVQGLTEEALEAFSSASRISPTDPYPYYYMGSLLADLDRLDEAIDMYRRSLEYDPQNPKAHYGLGQALKRSGRHEEAEVELAIHAEILKLARNRARGRRGGIATME